MKKFLKVLLAGVLVSGALVGCSQSDSKDAGKVVIYSPNTENEVNSIITAFEESTGIKVELVQGKTGEMVTRIDSEKGNPQADILWGGMNLGVYTTNPDLWEKYVSPNENLIDENYRNTTGYFTNYLL